MTEHDHADIDYLQDPQSDRLTIYQRGDGMEGAWVRCRNPMEIVP